MILRRDPLKGLGLVELAVAHLVYRLGRVEGLRKLSYLLFLASTMDPDTGGYEPLDLGLDFYLYIEGPMASGLGGVVAGLVERGVIRVRVEGFPGGMPSLADYIDFYDCKTLRILEPRGPAARAASRLPERILERIDAVAERYGSVTPSGLEKTLEKLGAGLADRIARVGSPYQGPVEVDGGGLKGVIVEARSGSKTYASRLGGIVFLESTGPIPRLRSLADVIASVEGEGSPRPLIQPVLAAPGGDVRCFDMLWAGGRGCLAAEVLEAVNADALPPSLRLCLERLTSSPCHGLVVIDCRLGGAPVCGVVNVLRAAPRGVAVLGLSSLDERDVLAQIASIIESTLGTR